MSTNTKPDISALQTELRRMAEQILTPGSRSKKFFNDCAEALASLAAENAGFDACLDREFGPKDERSGDLLDDLGAFIDHHKKKEAELAEMRKQEEQLLKDIVQLKAIAVCCMNKPKCGCGNPATCFGRYEEQTGLIEFACSECCGHGNEDGWCIPIAQKSRRVD